MDTQISDAADRAEKHAPGMPSDAVVWEDVEHRTQELTELSLSYLAFMVLAMMIAAVAIVIDQPMLLVGAMVVGPEFGPLAGVCVAIVERRRELVRTVADRAGRRLPGRRRADNRVLAVPERGRPGAGRVRAPRTTR